jgi:ribosomal protein L11 methylase PrmA
VGVDIDPALVREARANAETAGVADRVRFLNQDLFDTDISEATVVTLYLLPSLNEQLRPKLNAELAPGARVVSHEFGMGRWAPDETLNVGGRRVLVWTIPID